MTSFHERLNELYEQARDKNYKTGRKSYAEYLGVTVGQLSGWLDGNSEPCIQNLIKIAEREQVSLAWLLGQSNDHRIFIPPSESTWLPLEAKEDYDLLLDFLQYRYRKKTKRYLNDMAEKQKKRG